MGDLNFDDLIAVRVFRNGTEQELAYVEQDTVGDAKELLDGKFHQKGSFQRGPLLLKSERLLELGCIYSYYFTDTGSSQVKANENLTQFWQALKAAKIEEIEAGTLEDGTKRIIKILTLSASAFPGESEESKRLLLVRQCYEELADIMLDHFQQKGRVFVLNGNPGIGKSLFSFYFMWRLAQMGGQTLVWERKSAGKD